MSDISKPHDSLFKDFLSRIEYAQRFLEVHLPDDIKQICDLSTFELQDGSFIGNELKQRFSDILYRVKASGEDRLLYTIVEHQTKPERLLPLRVLSYEVDVLQKYCNKTKSERLPEVITLVFYRGKRKYPYSLDILDLFEAQGKKRRGDFPRIPTLIDVNTMSDEAIEAHGNIAILEKLQKYIWSKDLQELAPAVLKELMRYPLPAQLKNNVFRYMLSEGECKNFENFYRIVNEHDPQEGEEIMTVAQQLRAEGVRQGRQEGIQQGIQEGIQEGIEKIAIKLLRLLISLKKKSPL